MQMMPVTLSLLILVHSISWNLGGMEEFWLGGYVINDMCVCVCGSYTLLGKTLDFAVSGPISLVIFNWFN